MARVRTAARLHLLTVKQIQNAGDGDHTDGGGLLLRVREVSASWVFRFTSASGRREMGMGVAHRGSAAQAGDSLTSARKQAQAARDLLQQGIDPIDAREQRRAAALEAEQAKKASKERGHWTLARAAREYHERVIEPTRSSKHAAQWIASLEHHVPATVWSKPIAEIDAPELLKALQSVRGLDDKSQRIPETLQRVRQRLDAVFEDAIFHKRCNSNPAAAVRRKMREAMPEKQRGSFAALPYREAPGLLAQIRAADGTAARCLEFAVLTAARTSEALLARWSEFDLGEGVWTVPAGRMKAKEEHVVPLSFRALEILRHMQGMRLHHEWVFPSPMLKERPLSNMAMLTCPHPAVPA